MLANLLAAALVSAFVAFGVEWLAKPRLEARKERVLRRFRAGDELRRLLYEIMFDATKLKQQTSASSANGDDVQHVSDAITAATRSLENVFCSELMPFTGEKPTDLLAGYVGFVCGIMESARAPRDKGEQIVPRTAMLLDVLGGPGQGALYWARWRYRARQAAELKAFLDA